MEMSEDYSFKQLKVWIKAVDFAEVVIIESEKLASDRKHIRLLEQIESSAASVALNIAEGKGRHTKKEFRQFLYIARGSVYETITLLNIFKKLDWINKEQLVAVENMGSEINRMLNSLINSLK